LNPSETFWIDEEQRDEIYCGQACRFDCVRPAVVEVKRAKGALFPGKGGHEGSAEVGEVVGVGVVGGDVGGGQRRKGREDMSKERKSLNFGVRGSARAVVNASATRLGCQGSRLTLRAKASMPLEKVRVTSVVSWSMNEEVDMCQPRARGFFGGDGERRTSSPVLGGIDGQ
jgi:hypothetical protein